MDMACAQGDCDEPIKLHHFIYWNADPVLVVDPHGREGIVSLSLGIAGVGILAATTFGCTSASTRYVDTKEPLEDRCFKLKLAGRLRSSNHRGSLRA